MHFLPSHLLAWLQLPFISMLPRLLFWGSSFPISHLLPSYTPKPWSCKAPPICYIHIPCLKTPTWIVRSSFFLPHSYALHGYDPQWECDVPSLFWAHILCLITPRGVLRSRCSDDAGFLLLASFTSLVTYIPVWIISFFVQFTSPVFLHHCTMDRSPLLTLFTFPIQLTTAMMIQGSFSWECSDTVLWCDQILCPRTQLCWQLGIHLFASFISNA